MARFRRGRRRRFRGRRRGRRSHAWRVGIRM